jgi:glycerol-3-phosphate dehydrogenase
MWQRGWRESAWSSLTTSWDIIVIGGGITGAGILREAARMGLSVLLVEGHDFASGTSSRSSKLVHGGLRYLRNAQIKLTIESVNERERLLREGRGLVNPLGFLLTTYQGDAIPGWVFGAGLAIYDLLALEWGHRHYDSSDMRELCPYLAEEGLRGGYRYFDAQTDDARLVLRLIQEGAQDGGLALNYAFASELLRSASGEVRGVVLEDKAPETAGRTCEVEAKVVINATGAWADELRLRVGGLPRLRKLRGSHLIFPYNRLPITRAVNMLHPADGRPVFAVPWEGVTLLGTTDVDHDQPMQTDPSISAAEAEYLLAAVQKTFPDLDLGLRDVQATFSGVRPVIGTGKTDPSKESREHVLWFENGLLTVAGGKLTTFRLMALTALKAACARLTDKAMQKFSSTLKQRALNAVPADDLVEKGLNRAARMRLIGRYGADAQEMFACAQPDELQRIQGTSTLWAELRWAARSEATIHLDDLLLRRVRLGLLLPEGGLREVERIRQIVQPELGWDDSRWNQEIKHYTNLWHRCYDLPCS